MVRQSIIPGKFLLDKKVVDDAGSRHYAVKAGVALTTEDFDVSFEAADNMIEVLVTTSDRPPEWLKTFPEASKEPTIGSFVSWQGANSSPEQVDSDSWRRADTTFYELTETFDSAAADDAYFGLDVNTLGKVAQQFSTAERIPDVVKYELTEDLGPGDLDWNDSDFGFSDEQLEELWKRFETHMGDLDTDHEFMGDLDTNHELGAEFGTPPPEALKEDHQDELGLFPRPQEIPVCPETDYDATLEEKTDYDATLEEFLGEPVAPLMRPTMRAELLSTNTFDSVQWYLFKITDAGSNRFYMKTFADFEQLHFELEQVSLGRLESSVIPPLLTRDWLGVRRYFGGAEFESRRAEQLKIYVKALMSRAMSPMQEQVLRLFFGPSARGRILPPKGPLHRGLACGFQRQTSASMW